MQTSWCPECFDVAGARTTFCRSCISRDLVRKPVQDIPICESPGMGDDRDDLDEEPDEIIRIGDQPDTPAVTPDYHRQRAITVGFPFEAISSPSSYPLWQNDSHSPRKYSILSGERLRAVTADFSRKVFAVACVSHCAPLQTAKLMSQLAVLPVSPRRSILSYPIVQPAGALRYYFLDETTRVQVLFFSDCRWDI